jgi:hypothetical protein
VSPKGVPKLWDRGNVGPVRVFGESSQVPKVFYLGVKMCNILLFCIVIIFSIYGFKSFGTWYRMGLSL